MYYIRAHQFAEITWESPVKPSSSCRMKEGQVIKNTYNYIHVCT